MRPSLPPDWLTRFMMVVGLGCLLWTGWQVVETARFLHDGVYATGTICDESPHPCVQFALPAGQTVRFVQNGFVSRPVGAAVPVVYRAGDPAGTAQVATVWTTWVSALWMLPAGLGFGVLPLFGARAYLRGSRS